MTAMSRTLAFTADVAARLTGLSEDQLRDWDNAGFLEPEFAAPNRRRPYSRIYSFQDLVKLRTIAGLRQHGVPTQRLKKIGGFLDSIEDASWASTTFYVIGKDVYFTHQEALQAARPLGQQAIREILTIDLQPIVADVRKGVDGLKQRSPQEIGRVIRDRFIHGGQPILAGTRIPTATVYEFVRRGYTSDGILREFPRLVQADIDAAISEEEQAVGDAVRRTG